MLPTIEKSIFVDGRKVPYCCWIPQTSDENIHQRYPIVLVGHGGSGHKKSQLVLDLVEQIVQPHQIAVVAIDGPVHGERREVFIDGPTVRQEFRYLWQTGNSIDTMIADWQACINDIFNHPQLDSTKIAWYGISMGTAYGLPLVAADQRIKAALLGMWGTCRTPNERLIVDAPQINIPILFQIKNDDEIFTRVGQEHLYSLISSTEKEVRYYPGGHLDPKDTQLDEIVQFLVQHLKNPNA